MEPPCSHAARFVICFSLSQTVVSDTGFVLFLCKYAEIAPSVCRIYLGLLMGKDEWNQLNSACPRWGARFAALVRAEA